MLTKNQSFLEFLRSKEVLLRAADGPQISTSEYVIQRYVKFPISESGKRVERNMKPGDVITVKWIYRDGESIPIKVKIGPEPVQCNFSNQKLASWLSKNSIKQSRGKTNVGI